VVRLVNSFVLLITEMITSDPQLVANIRMSTLLMPHVRQLAQSPPTSPTSSIRSGHSRTRSYDDPDGGEGQSEIATLARRIIELVEGDDGAVHAAAVPGSVTGSAVSGSYQDSSYRGRDRGHAEDELRKSISEAFKDQ
jgi:vacuolar protein 8